MTSWSELRRDALAVEEHNLLHPQEPAKVPYVTQRLSEAEGPFIATSDYMHAVQDQIRQWVPGDYATLGADGFGFADTRAAARRFFKIDSHSVVVRALDALAKQGKVPLGMVQQAISKYDLHDVTAGVSGTAGGDA